MFWTIEKLEKRIIELETYRYKEVKEIPSFHMQLDEEGEVGAKPPSNSSEWAEIHVNERWEGRDKYLWLNTEVAIPKEWSDQTIVGVFDFGITGGGNNSSFESLLYLNGKPYQGVDMNHQEVFLPHGLAGSTAQLTFRLWSGLEGGGKPTIQEHKLKKAFISVLDENTDDLYYTSKAALDTIKYLPETQPERQALLKVLDKAYLAIDWSLSGLPEFYQTVNEANQYLQLEIDKMPKNYPVTVQAIGHTHIDVAWLWRLKHTREKAARSFSTVLRLMEKFPDYVFLQTQPQLYDYIKNDYPEIYSQIKKRIEEGRWEADGAMWLEADCNLTSGESLVRQLLFGTAFFRKEFNRECEYLWLPDVFGYSWALPQILSKSGIKTFMTTKISWSQYNKMPHDTFKWRGIDGTEILTHFITTPEDEYWFYTYNGKITPRTVKGIWEAYRDKSVNQELLLSYGYGDGGGGVNREMLEMRRRLDKMPGLPKVKTGRADEFFKRLHETVEQTDQYVHTWDGELYLEYHRGTYTSQANNKRSNRKMELLLRETEWMNALNCAIQKNWSLYPKQKIDESWKIVLRNQFHDIIPGSSIKEVYEDSKLEYEEAEKLAYQGWENAASGLVSEKENSFTVFNSSTFSRNDLLEIKEDVGRDIHWVDNNGNLLEAEQSADNTWLINVRDLPATGITSIHYQQGKKDRKPNFSAEQNRLTTPFYLIRWNEKGQLIELFDRENNRHILAEGSRGNVLQVFEDKPMQYDAWDIDIYYQQKMREIDELLHVELIESGSLRSTIQFKWKYKNSVVIQNMMVYSTNRRIDFKTTINWNEQDQLLKVAFPVEIRATEATYDIQYGNVKRPTHWNTSWDYARFESVGHQWVDLSETGYGISLLNDCKYGHDIKDNTIRLTLLKSATYPDISQDQGEHQFTYSLLPHKDGWIEGNTVEEAWNLNNPLTYLKGCARKDVSLFTVDKYNVLIDAIKKAEDSDRLIVRLHEFTGARTNITLKSDLNIDFIQECDLMERAVGEKMEASELQFSINPYEIKTFIIASKK